MKGGGWGQKSNVVIEPAVVVVEVDVVVVVVTQCEFVDMLNGWLLLWGC